MASNLKSYSKGSVQQYHLVKNNNTRGSIRFLACIWQEECNSVANAYPTQSSKQKRVKDPDNLEEQRLKQSRVGGEDQADVGVR